MPRKKKEFLLSEEELEMLDGHVHDCTIKISPEGHRPAAFCNSLVYWISKKPLKWKSHKADYEDRSREHHCREWTPEEDQIIKDAWRTVAIMRGGNVDNLISYESSANRTKILKKKERKERKARGEFVKKKPASDIYRNGKPADAVIRKSRKEHGCHGKCKTTIKLQEKYLSVHEGEGSEYSPLRLCFSCASNIGYEIPEYEG